MGMTFCNLHLYGLDRRSIVGAMGAGDALREINAPWLAVLPPMDEANEGADRLLRLARALTKGRPDALALHFYCFDDESFHIRVCRDGRCVKTLSDEQPWVFLARLLADLYDDASLDQAFRHKNQCVDLEEKLQLLEETVGEAFYDGPWSELRRVERSTAMRDRLAARAARLRRLRNRFELTPLLVDEWPEYPRACLELASALPNTFESNYHSVLGDPFWKRFAVPRQPWRVVMTVWNRDKDRLLTLYDAREKRLRRIVTDIKIERTLWVTRQGFPVVIAFGPEDAGLKRVVCLNDSGEAVWRFEPSLDRFQSLNWTEPTPEGLLTIACYEPKSKAMRVWQVDGETGRVVRHARLPWKTLIRMDALGGYAAADASGHRLALLDDGLESRAEWALEAPMRPEYSFPAGSTVWTRIMERGALHGFDFAAGEPRAVRPELPVYLESVQPDGTMATTGTGADLLLLDAEGRLVSRHRLEGWRIDRLPDGMPCAVEIVGWPDSAMFTPEVLDRLALRVWAIRES